MSARGDDTAIEQAWQRRQQAYAEYNALPDDQWGQGTTFSPAEARLWAIIDAADEELRAAVASTPRGVEIQLWVALYHSVSGREDDAAISRGDLQRLSELEEKLDFNARMILAALRSLQSM